MRRTLRTLGRLHHALRRMRDRACRIVQAFTLIGALYGFRLD
jgi:hypothetical protein